MFADKSDRSEYRSVAGGFSFEYPKKWGKITESKTTTRLDIMYVPDGDLSSQGLLTAMSPEYTLDGMPGSSVTEFYGSVVQLQSLFSCSHWKLKPCRTFEIQGRKAIEFFETVSYSGGISLLKRVFIHNPGSTYPAIALSAFVTSCNDCKNKTSVDVINIIQQKIGSVDFSEKVSGLNLVISSFKFE